MLAFFSPHTGDRLTGLSPGFMEWTSEQIDALLFNTNRQAEAAEYLGNDTYNILQNMQGVMLFQHEANQRIGQLQTFSFVVAFVVLLDLGWRIYDLSISRRRTSGDVGLRE